MTSEPLTYQELTDINDDLLLPWLDLMETAFPPTERVLPSFHLGLLRQKARGETSAHTMVAAVDAEGRFVGLLQYQLELECEAAFMWYLAVVRDLRSQGLGAQIYQEAVRRLAPHHLRALTFEVEIPEGAHDEETRQFALRRIAFYRRQGARLLTGIHYVQSVGSHQPSIPMHIMVHPFVPMDADAAFGLAKCVFGDALTQIGPLDLT
jgi:ribosomal protein S18 acetylase RimI-like enzyme